MPPMTASLNSLTVTNPLVLYRTLLALKKIDPDPAQHRLALELQNVYFRLKDYSPEDEYGARLKAITKASELTTPSKFVDNGRTVAIPGHPLRQNPLFSHLFPKSRNAHALALTKVLTSHEAALNLKSPKGMLLYGEVGTGKSMLLDLLASSLPNPKKRRWHFNTFMLEILSRLESLRLSRPSQSSEYSMVWLANELIIQSPILFLDEFQLPDRASSKILSNLLTPFFQLGGVLVASSNRMPDELMKANGMNFSVEARGAGVRSWLGLGGRRERGAVLPDNEYGQFVEMLKARCEFWDMNASRDWRRRQAENRDDAAVERVEKSREELLGSFTGWENPEEISSMLFETATSDDGESTTTALRPLKYFLSTSTDSVFRDAEASLFPPETTTPIPWQPATLHVYGRIVSVPQQHDGITQWTFASLCASSFGPADYITLASTYHTLVLTDVPILRISQKNEARRFITLLDALYEARCKLLIRAAAGPDELFFPETKQAISIDGERCSGREENDGADAVYSETLSEIYQDATAPFRPNVSPYISSSSSGYDPNEDSDFGPLGRRSETGHIGGADFGKTGSFTGEDERFAFKRARSRLWEMCGERWHGREEDGWWMPVPREVRRWEGVSGEVCLKGGLEGGGIGSDMKMGGFVELEEVAGLKRDHELGAPFREVGEKPTVIGEAQTWGVGKCGKQSGALGRSIGDLGDRAKKE
ncbi:AFG1-like ATPase-domain-containing protein [Calycina marina]|uniref:AFG1-like ATPase-domain-containing protein n=1 Tax=Calycina marina TaxID=1763456 RepID=A0A9P7ZAM6_9HELO|nr:AFG1-like ATPase-domain-containing protein [Calycina marina]